MRGFDPIGSMLVVLRCVLPRGSQAAQRMTSLCIIGSELKYSKLSAFARKISLLANTPFFVENWIHLLK